jgi:hypothetical protein
MCCWMVEAIVLASTASAHARSHTSPAPGSTMRTSHPWSPSRVATV